MSRVTIGIPVYKGVEFLAETVESVLSQTDDDWQVFFSIDGPDARCEELCGRFMVDRRFKVQVHGRRLGWLRNIASLQDRADTEFWCLLPQDDIWEPTYLEALIDRAMSSPGAAVTYCDIAGFGRRQPVFRRPSVVGDDSVERLLNFLRAHFAGVAFRGLTRVASLRSTQGGIVPNDADDFAADTVWAAVMATSGELVRVPEPLYRKRFHEDNVHERWMSWDRDRRTVAWIAHCHDMLAVAAQLPARLIDRWRLWEAIVDRLTRSRATEFLPWDELEDLDRVALVEDLLIRVAALGRLSVCDWLHAPMVEVRRVAIAIATESSLQGDGGFTVSAAIEPRSS